MNRHRVQTLIIAATLPVALLFAMGYPSVRDFYWSHYVTKDEWQARHRWDRKCLARPIVRYKMLSGMAVDQVIDLLGEPEIPGGKKVGADGSITDLCYCVATGLAFDGNMLDIHFEDGIVTDAELGSEE